MSGRSREKIREGELVGIQDALGRVCERIRVRRLLWGGRFLMEDGRIITRPNLTKLAGRGAHRKN